VYVLLGAGDGTFRADVVLTTEETASNGIAGVLAGDLDGDGKLDLALNNENGIDVYLGKGDGSFQPRIETYMYSGDALAFGDLDGDGKQDVVTEALMGAVGLYGKDRWSFNTRSQELPLSSEPANSIAIADLDGDGKLDVAATDFYSVNVAIGNGDGTFKPSQHFPGGNEADSIVVHDFNADGRLDLAFTDSGANVVRILLSGTAPLACR